jgi:hypothetical protein
MNDKEIEVGVGGQLTATVTTSGDECHPAFVGSRSYRRDRPNPVVGATSKLTREIQSVKRLIGKEFVALRFQ